MWEFSRRRRILLIVALATFTVFTNDLGAQVIEGGTPMFYGGSQLQQPPPIRFKDSDSEAVAQNANVKKYSLSGTVVNALSGEGIPRAMVQINQLATMTDSSGSFSFDGLPQGMYFVMAQKPGFFSATSPNRPPGVTTTLGPEAQPVTISLAPEAVIYGRITDSDGLPVAQLNVDVMRSVVSDGRRNWQPVNGKQTDADGDYRIAGLQPGTYLVIAGPSQIPAIGAMARTGQQNSGYGVAYYPAPADGGANAGLQITAGQKVSADLSVDAEPFYSVTGTLNAPQGSGVWLNMTPRNNLRTNRGETVMRGDNNTFTIRMIPPGDYILHAGTQVQGKQWDAFVPLHIAGDITGLPLVLQPSASIPITTHVERTQPTDADAGRSQIGSVITPRVGVVSSSRIAFHGPPVQVVLRSHENPQQQFWAMYRPPQQGGDGETFSFENIPPGTYKVEFRSMQRDLYVASARYGNADLLRDDLVIGQNAGPDPIDITLRDDGAKVSVKLAGAGEASNSGFRNETRFLIIPDHGTPFSPNLQTFSSTGGYTFGGLRPGGYSILAFDDLTNLEYENPNVLDPYMLKAAHVDLSANDDASVTVQLQKVGAQ